MAPMGPLPWASLSFPRWSQPILAVAALLWAAPTNVVCNPGPMITEDIGNSTVALGREATLKCVVTHLSDYKVAWVHIDRQMILTIGRHVITRIPRFNIQHDSHHTWTLQIRDVAAEDRGYYMCQVNTDPMISMTGHLDVVVPPTIIDEESSPSTVSVREKHNASLICKSHGVPQPNITWRREDGRPIFRDSHKTKPRTMESSVHRGEYLDLQDISREQMGAYLCIASNKIPPSVSKRITLIVEFQPMMYIPNQLIGAPVDTEVTVECTTEASPKAITYWVFKDVMILRSLRHHTEEEVEGYRLHSRLTIHQVTRSDFGAYKCVSKNSLGETEGQIRLYEIASESTVATQSPTEATSRERPVKPTTRQTFPYDPGLPEGTGSSRRVEEGGRRREGKRRGGGRRQHVERKEEKWEEGEQESWNWTSPAPRPQPGRLLALPPLLLLLLSCCFSKIGPN